MSKQDRQGVRTPAGLEQKYNFGNVFSRLYGENQQQNLTMRQFAELVTENLATIQKDIEGLNTSVQSLSEKDTQLENAMEQSDTSLDNKIKAYWKTIYPVGAIYVSVSSTSPATLFGGTWTQIKDTFLLASGSTYSAGSTGGEATHTLSVNEMPSHDHRVTIGNGFANYVYWAGNLGSTDKNAAGLGYQSEVVTNTLWAEKSGGGAAHNNMPPYLAVYVWKRTG